MDQMTAQHRLHSQCSLCLVRVLLGSLLALSSLSVDTGPIAAHDSDQWSSAARPDFRFKPPWVTFGLRGGWAFNRSDSEIHDFLNENLTLNDSDFDGPAFTMDVAVRAMSWMDVVAGFEVSGRRSKSEFRNFVELSGASIKQKTTLTQVPLTLSLKLYPLGRGRQVGEYAWIRSTLVPYVGGGIGATWYKLKRRYGEIWCYGVAAVTAIFFARYAIKTNFGSAKWNDISQGLDATPLWIPQIAMSIGTVLLAVALVDQFLRVLLTEHSGVEQPDVADHEG